MKIWKGLFLLVLLSIGYAHFGSNPARSIASTISCNELLADLMRDDLKNIGQENVNYKSYDSIVAEVKKKEYIESPFKVALGFSNVLFADFMTFDTQIYAKTIKPQNSDFLIPLRYWFDDRRMYQNSKGFDRLLNDFASVSRHENSSWHRTGRPDSDYWASFASFLSYTRSKSDLDSAASYRKRLFAAKFIQMSKEERKSIIDKMVEGVNYWADAVWSRYRNQLSDINRGAISLTDEVLATESAARKMSEKYIKTSEQLLTNIAELKQQLLNSDIDENIVSNFISGIKLHHEAILREDSNLSLRYNVTFDRELISKKSLALLETISLQMNSLIPQREGLRQLRTLHSSAEYIQLINMAIQ